MAKKFTIDAGMSRQDQIYAELMKGKPVSSTFIAIKYGMAAPTATISNIRRKNRAVITSARVPMQNLIGELKRAGIDMPIEYAANMKMTEYRIDKDATRLLRNGTLKDIPKGKRPM